MDNSKALKLSIIDGTFSAIMVTLCGGIFLTGFALKVLKADARVIGILASLPLFANLVQFIGSYLIEKTGKSKSLCILSAALSRSLWILILFLPLKLIPGGTDLRIWMLVGVIAISSIFASMAGVAWTSWMSELVPEKIRGSYFGKRNMITSLFGMFFIMGGGYFLSSWEKARGESDPYGFLILFIVGIGSGLLSLFFLRKIPPAEAEKKKGRKKISAAASFKAPLKDKNFRNILFFAALWIFAINFAGPFYGVYMINILELDFSLITLLGTAATLSTVIMMKIWGKINDKLGSKPVIIISTLMLALIPFLWIFASSENFYIPLLTAHIISGAFMAGAGLSQFNILIKLSPREGRSAYLALFAAVSGFAGACAPLAGAFLFNRISSLTIALNFITIGGFDFIFLSSSILTAFSIAAAARIHEEGSAPPYAVMLQLKNDLNPQTGVAGAADILMLNVARSGNIIKKIDRKSEKLAHKSEKAIRQIADKTEQKIRKPIGKIKKFLEEED